MTTHTDATTLNNSNQTDHFLITTKNAGIIWKRVTMDANHLVSMETLSRRQARPCKVHLKITILSSITR